MLQLARVLGSGMKIGILGSGSVGQALARGLARHDHEVRIGTRREEVEGLPTGTPREVVEEAELVVLAVSGAAAEEVARSVAEPLGDKVLIDATNPLDFSTGAPRLFVGHDDSLGERVQRAAPRSSVVKAYNIVGNTLMVDPQLPGGPPTMLIGGDDEDAKSVVTRLLHDTGWEVADLGGIEASRYLEPLTMAWVLYGMREGSREHAIRMLHR
jgi:8-hydroxy-5-deazaflavin:NADPH oxidoreductase